MTKTAVVHVEVRATTSTGEVIAYEHSSPPAIGGLTRGGMINILSDLLDTILDDCRERGLV